MSVFTNNLAKILRVCNLSMAQVARMAKVPTSTISRVMSDEHKPQNRTVEAIADAFECSVFDLLFKQLSEEDISKFGRKRPGELQSAIQLISVDTERHPFDPEFSLTCLFDEESLKIAFDNRLLPDDHKVAGTIQCVCDTDDLLPKVERGDTLYVRPLQNDEEIKKLPQIAFVVGKIQESPILGTFSTSCGSFYVSPTNPTARGEAYKVEKIAGVIVSWQHFVKL